MFKGQAEIFISAAPVDVYSVVADVTRMGEWSPECYRCEWQGDATGATYGARFRGWSKSSFLRWSRLLQVEAADPGKQFQFVTLKDFVNKDSTIWTYRFRKQDGGTLLTESYEGTAEPSLPIRIVSRLAKRPHDMVPHMDRTLANIKSAIEEGSRSTPTRHG